MLIYYLCFMQSITVVILLFGVNRYIKLRYIDILAKTSLFKMTSDTDDIIDQLLGESTGEIADEVLNSNAKENVW